MGYPAGRWNRRKPCAVSWMRRSTLNPWISEIFLPADFDYEAASTRVQVFYLKY